MTMTTADPRRTHLPRQESLDVRTARTTGLLYLAVGVTGMLGFLVVRPRLFDPDDPAGTAANLVTHDWLASTGIALELGLVISQALAALWFFKLYRPAAWLPAAGIAGFGMANALTVLASAACLTTAARVADQPSGNRDAQLLYGLSEGLWAVGSVFFGLWLVPMGIAVLRSGWGPRALGRLLVVGGVGYVLSAFVASALPNSPDAAASVLVLPATVGELWMVGWLLLRGAGARRVR